MCKFCKAYLKFMKHSSEFIEIVEDAKSRIREIDVADTIARMNEGAVLIDVREDNEWDAAHARDAVHLGRGIIERDVVEQYPGKDTEMILYCGGGFRSALAADMLQKMGYTNVHSMAGGWKAWKDADGAVE